MGKVVKLDAAGDRATARPAPGGRQPAPPRRSKSALVLGGGGFTGGVYEIGALRALDLLSVNRTVNQFDVYVGTSAGSFVAAAVANGVTPEEMMRVIVQQVPTPFPDARVSSLLQAQLRRVPDQGRRCSRCGWPAAAHAGAGPAARCRRSTWRSAWPRRSPRAVLGRGHRALRPADPVRPRPHRRLPPARPASSISPPPISTRASGSCSARRAGTTCRSPRAVSASSALPMIYKPVKIKDRELIDGGIVSTTNLDIAVEAGAKFIVVVNPLVPYVNDFEKRIPTITGSRAAPRLGHGLPPDRLPGVQAARLPAAARAGRALGGALSRASTSS